MLGDRQNLRRNQLLKEWGTGLSLLSWHRRLIRICSTGNIVSLVSVPEVTCHEYRGPECLFCNLRGEFRFGVVKKGQSRRLNFFYKGNNLVNLWEGSEITIVLLKLYFVILKGFIWGQCLLLEVEQGYLFLFSELNSNNWRIPLQAPRSYKLSSSSFCDSIPQGNFYEIITECNYLS